MCGIAGFIDLWDSGETFADEERAAILDRMCRIISHRGPDDQGTLLKKGVALGMRRLSIIDVAGGHQPISGEDGTVTLVFNGEIYNFQELTPDLKSRGHQFKTHSDTETIVHSYEEFGADCVQRLRGMFAFAIWDDKARNLYIARDRAGKKPLFYTLTTRGTLVFGSELKSLLQHPDVEREVDPKALDAYFTLGYVPDPLSIFRNVHKLPPGHFLNFSNGEVTVKQYWDFNFEPSALRSEADYIEELQSLLDESVKLRLISEVPLGAFLSGGIDSSTIVALMARHLDQPVKTFSIGFHEDSYNELKYARVTAEKFGTDHHEFFVTPDICKIVDELAWHLDEPFADQATIPNYIVSKLAREYVTVVLSGDGGDELFAGYTRYLVEQNRGGFEKLPKPLREGVMRPLSQRLPHSMWGRNYLHNVSLDPISRYLDNVSVFTSLNRKSLYTSQFLEAIGSNSFSSNLFHELAGKVKTSDAVDRLLYLDSKTYLPGDILTKVDRTSMAVSLEARAPLLDHKLIDFVTRIPSSMKLAGSQTKHIFKKAIENLIPGEVLHRPKQGFGVPIQEWINQELKDRIRETLTEPRTQQRGYINPKYVNVLLEEHERGRRDHSLSLWSLLMVELWHRQFLDDENSALRLASNKHDAQPVAVAG
ncbi:MAG TPA: asparagine synthase (glutamine-hydrolyzing) [Pyrinomonadaceae bacterium]|jgi:asparagine synthase (glutamine-hydrolyzing)|nr:asparagine synthase (glutamine-hydrolyzing) [Pyrinomonadaceae bacterium]